MQHITINNKLDSILHKIIFSRSIILLFCNYVSLSIAKKPNKLLEIDLKVNNNNKLSINKISNQTLSPNKSDNDFTLFYSEREIICNYSNINDIVSPMFVNALLNENKLCILSGTIIED